MPIHRCLCECVRACVRVASDEFKRRGGDDDDDGDDDGLDSPQRDPTGRLPARILILYVTVIRVTHKRART